MALVRCIEHRPQKGKHEYVSRLVILTRQRFVVALDVRTLDWSG